MKNMLNRTLLFLVDAVCFLGICASLSAIVHLGEVAIPATAKFDSSWPMMHASAAKFMLPPAEVAREKE